MHFLTFVALVITQFLCLLHALKRDYQASYILSVVMFPLIGPILYLYFESKMILERKINFFKIRHWLRRIMANTFVSRYEK